MGDPALAAACAFLAAAAVTAGLVAAFLRYARRRGLGQAVREDGPQTHLAKAGTPTMGGVAFLPALWAAACVAVVSDPRRWAVAACVAGAATAFGLLGMADDVAKVKRRRSTGILARWRILAELAFAAGAVWAIASLGSWAPHANWLSAAVAGPLAPLVSVLAIVGAVNGVNFSDGVDGLASTLVAIALVPFCLAAMASGNAALACLAAGGIGICLAFLAFNWHPASIFMGDTGSAALGALLGLLAVALRLELLLLIAGAVFVAEALSVIIQVIYFRATGGKRIFRMAPLHHHFELGGLAETQVVGRFALAGTIAAAASCWLVWQFS